MASGRSLNPIAENFKTAIDMSFNTNYEQIELGTNVHSYHLKPAAAHECQSQQSYPPEAQQYDWHVRL